MDQYEILAALIGFTQREEYQPIVDCEVENTLLKLLSDTSYNEILEIGEEYLITHPFSIQALYACGIAEFELQKLNMKKYYFKFNAIMQDIEKSGTGKSIESPFFTLGSHDGRFIGQVLNYGQFKSVQLIMDSNFNNIDVYTFLDAEGKKNEMYCIIEHAFNRNSALLKSSRFST